MRKMAWKTLRERVCLHQASASMLQQLCDDTSDTVVIENNGVAPEWDCNPFSSNSFVFNENSTISVIAEFRLMLGVDGLLTRL